MKRTLIIWITILMIFVSLSTPVFADDETVVQGDIEAERDDSVVFPQEERDLVQNTENDIIIKIYSGCFIHKFAERASIDELIYDKDFCLDEIYGIIDKETFKMRQHKHIWVDGKVYKITQYIGGVPDWPYDYMVPKVLSYNEYFSSSNVIDEFEDITVYEVYCLDETPAHRGWYVYYVTSIGDYVYYSDFGDVEIEEYFMPVEEFYEFAEKKVTEEYVNRPGVHVDGGEAGNHNGSEQDDQFNPINLVWIPFVVLAVVAAIFIFLKRKRRST